MHWHKNTHGRICEELSLILGKGNWVAGTGVGERLFHCVLLCTYKNLNRNYHPLKINWKIKRKASTLVSSTHLSCMSLPKCFGTHPSVLGTTYRILSDPKKHPIMVTLTSYCLVNHPSEGPAFSRPFESLPQDVSMSHQSAYLSSV